MISGIGSSPAARAIPTPPDQLAKETALREAATELEANFISEMLKAAKFGEPLETFGGGIGEDQFSSFLRNEHASALAEKGGFGLADAIFDAFVDREERLSDQSR